MDLKDKIQYIGFQELCKRGWIGSVTVPILEKLGREGRCKEISKHLSLIIEKEEAKNFYIANSIGALEAKSDEAEHDWETSVKTLQVKLRAGVQQRRKSEPFPNIHLENTRRFSAKNIDKQEGGHIPYTKDSFDFLHVIYPKMYKHNDQGIIIADYSFLQHLLVPVEELISKKGESLKFPPSRSFFDSMIEKQEDFINQLRSV